MPALPARHSLYWASSVFIQKELHTVFLPDVATITFSCNVMIIKLTHMPSVGDVILTVTFQWWT